MENKSNVLNETKKIIVKDQKVTLENRKKMTITAVTKALSANATSVILQSSLGKIYITGSDLHLSKLDIEQGVVEIEGLISAFKYANSDATQGFFKRIFK